MKRSSKTLLTCIAVCAVVFLGSQAWAISLSFDPLASTVDKGESFDVAINISGLDSDILAVYGFTVNFDNDFLSFDECAFGSELEDDFGDSVKSAVLGTDSVRIDESAWWWADLSLQPEAFTLATLSFTATDVGDSDPLTFSNVLLADESWLPITLSADLGTGSVSVAPVPEPGTVILLGVGLLGMVGFRKRFQGKDRS